MRHQSAVIIALAAMLAISCGRRADVIWIDGNFEVYALDMDFTATKLGYNHHPGTLGLVEEEVVAAGSTALFVFVERVDKSSGRTEFYVVQRYFIWTGGWASDSGCAGRLCAGSLASA
jgi:hypothetical protein